MTAPTPPAKTEHRGLATKVEVTTAGSTWSSIGAYDADGSMTVQKLPGGDHAVHRLRQRR